MADYDELTIKMLEEDRDSFVSRGGLDIVDFVSRKHSRIEGFSDYAGEYYKKPEYFRMGTDFVYKKKQMAGELPAEVILAHAYNQLGIPSPIAYPYFMKTYIPVGERYKPLKDMFIIPDGVVTKDVVQIFPTAVKRSDDACHTIHGLFTDEECLKNTTQRGRIARIKETIASIAFNNKDAGYDNSFWVRDSKGMYDGVVSIDHGYSGRDSMYIPSYLEYMKVLYSKGEHGYNGMFEVEEDRGTTIYYLRQLLDGKAVAGVQLSREEIAELNHFIKEIKALDFNKIKKDFCDRFKYDCSYAFMRGLEWSREDLCENLL